MNSLLLVSVLVSIVAAVADQVLSNDKAKKLVNFSLDVFSKGTEVEMRLAAIRKVVETKREAAKAAGVVWEPTEQELSELFAAIEARDAAWAGIGLE